MTTEEMKCQLDAYEACASALKSILDVAAKVGDAPGRPGVPDLQASSDAVAEIRRIVEGLEAVICGKGGPAEPEEPGEPPERGVCTLPSVGPAPYKAELVHARDGALVAEVPGRHATEEVAVEAVLAAARAHGAQVDYGCTRHWLTNKREHIVDFGSHGVYGRITSVKEGE